MYTLTAAYKVPPVTYYVLVYHKLYKMAPDLVAAYWLLATYPGIEFCSCLQTSLSSATYFLLRTFMYPMSAMDRMKNMLAKTEVTVMAAVLS